MHPMELNMPLITKNQILDRRPARLAVGLGLTAALLWAALSIAVNAAPPSKAWSTSVEASLATAQRTGRPVLVMFSASWCPPCNMMKSDVFPTTGVQTALKQWIPVYVDVDENKPVARQYNIDSMPTFVLLDPAGNELVRRPGAMAPNDFVSFIGKFRAYHDRLGHLEKNLGASPSDPALLREKGKILEDMDRTEAALQTYRKAASLDPEKKLGLEADILFLEAYAKARKGDFKAADADLFRLRREFPNSERSGSALFIRAVIALESSQNDQARTLLEEYKANYPKGEYSGPADQFLANLKQKN